jgi:cellulose synthase/poly-beta-1,6-N-acetylglucosamine synthase-like glycosyltransferase
VIVDDGSSDGSAEVAERFADVLVRLEGRARGPALARNRGVEAARGGIVAFVDVDVIVHPDALPRMLEVLESDPALAAVFGAYDETPEASGFFSQYRNLLHRYVHLAGAGDADTFWAGCGAVRRAAFHEAGGFDAAAFPRPQIEDIDLGYRLRDRGWRIRLQPEIQGTHLKRWTLPGMIRTDVLDRGLPWMRLMLRRASPGTLNVRRSEKIKTGLVALALLLALIALVSGSQVWLWPSLTTLAAALLANFPLYSWFAERRGVSFALGVVPMSVLYYALNAGCAATACALHVKEKVLR